MPSPPQGGEFFIAYYTNFTPYKHISIFNSKSQIIVR